MNDFQDISVLLAASRNQMGENIRDHFGASFIAEVFDPMLLEAAGLVSLHEEVESSLDAADRVIAEARSVREPEAR